MKESNNLTVNRSADKIFSNQNTKRAAVLPAVDIYEDAAGITLHADLPGVSKERLTIKVEANELLIEGEIAVAAPSEVRVIHGEVREPFFRRVFTLGQDLDKDQISANLKQGVLTLHIPRLREAQPRQIQIDVT